MYKNWEYNWGGSILSIKTGSNASGRSIQTGNLGVQENEVEDESESILLK